MSGKGRRLKTLPEKVVSAIQWLLLGLLVLLLFGFYRFHSAAAAYRTGAPPAADGVVVLTGDKGRIRAGLDLLGAGKGKRLLVSGVNPVVPERTLRQLYATDPGLTSRVDFGPVAANTAGNAREAAEWATKHGYRSLIVVTHDYHMARSLQLFGAEMPAIALYPRAIESHANFPFWFREYLKYLAAGVAPQLARDGLAKLPKADAHAT